jgi:chorismate--pyruvate lyase
LSSFFQQRREPIWHSLCHTPARIDAHYLPWLLDKGSLTQKLVARSQGDFRVDVLKQSIQSIHFSEGQALGLSSRQWAVVREVILYGQQVAWVYARTIIPLATLHGPLRRLHYLGNKPLGEQLFTDPSMKREPMQIAQIQAQQLPPTLALSQATWGRRSVFRLANKPLLVSEFFLPALF